MNIGFVLYLVSIATSCRIFCIVGTVIFYTVVALPEASASANSATPANIKI